MTMSLTSRYFYGLIVLAGQFLLVAGFTGYKIWWLKNRYTESVPDQGTFNH